MPEKATPRLGWLTIGTDLLKTTSGDVLDNRGVLLDISIHVWVVFFFFFHYICAKRTTGKEKRGNALGEGFNMTKRTPKYHGAEIREKEQQIQRQ